MAQAESNGLKDNLLDKSHLQEEKCFGDWKFLAVRDHILESTCNHSETQKSNCKLCRLFTLLPNLQQLPDMVFSENLLRISHKSGANITFNTLDALRMIDSNETNENLKVAASKEWSEARQFTGLLDNVYKPYDWTYTTAYRGTLEGFKVETSPLGRIDLESLKVHEPILFYEEIPLFEDELADHGCAVLSIKLRVMPSGFFALQRFYLRVDHVFVRILDTRIRWQSNHNYIQREWSKREAKIDEMNEEQKNNLLDPNALWPMLPVLDEKIESLSF